VWHRYTRADDLAAGDDTGWDHVPYRYTGTID